MHKQISNKHLCINHCYAAILNRKLLKLITWQVQWLTFMITKLHWLPVQDGRIATISTQAPWGVSNFKNDFTRDILQGMIIKL